MEKFIKICGEIPLGFEIVAPSGNDYIFLPDENFLPINLKNFFGEIVTVNSFSECFYYVNLGWKINPITFELVIKIILIFFAVLSLILLFKFKNVNIKEILSKIEKVLNKLFTLKINSIFILFEILVVVLFVFNKSTALKPFIDEYVSITSSYNFFKNLNFTAGEFLGGSHSIYLTSGPISAVGSVVGWILTKNIVVSRMLNYFWVFLLNLIFYRYLMSKMKSSPTLGFIFTIPIFLLIPWWQGILYGLGEVVSMVLFINAVFIFKHNRKLSLVMFSISIFMGKLLTFLPFFGFYTTFVFFEKNIRKIISDFYYFILPLLPWFLIINYRYSPGSWLLFLKRTYEFITTGNSASGVNEFNDLNLYSIIENLNSSEFVQWNSLDKFRILIIPILILLLIFNNRENIKINFGNITIPFIFGITIHYLWFWIISPLKWIRYSQHFTVPLIIFICYMFIFDIFKNSKNEIFGGLFIIFFIDSNELFNSLIFLFSAIFFYKYFKNTFNTLIKALLIFIIIFNISLSVVKNFSIDQSVISFNSCKINLTSDICRQDYLRYKN